VFYCWAEGFGIFRVKWSSLREEGFELTCCEGAVDAWGELERRPYAVVIANEDLSGEPGLLFLRRVGQIHPLLPGFLFRARLKMKF